MRALVSVGSLASLLLCACQPGVLTSGFTAEDGGSGDAARRDGSEEDAMMPARPDAAVGTVTDAAPVSQDSDVAPDAGEPVDAAAPDTARPPSGPPRYCEVDGVIAMEAEAFSASEGFSTVPRGDASGGAVMQVGDRGALSFDVEVTHSGRMYLWLRTYATTPESNGLHVELDGSRIEAPAGHREAGSDNIYLDKYGWSWIPEWQGDGTHLGPVTLEVGAGSHRLTITKRLIERPLIDRVVLTWASAPPSGLGPADTPCP